MVASGGRFEWGPEEATLTFPHPFTQERKRCTCWIVNGLPYLRWDDWKLLRIALSRAHTTNMKGICVHKAKAEQQQEVLEWPPQVEEESVVEVAKAVADTTEAAARERLRSDIPICHDELVKLIKLAELKLATTRRSSKVVGQEGFLRMWIFGVFVHGGKNGLTSLLRQRTHLARAIARYMVGKSSEPFATVVVTFIPHRDPNDGQYKTTISGLTSFCGGQLWTENVGAEYDDHTVWRYVREGGKALPGRLHQLADGRSTTFQVTAWHGTEPYEGNQMVCIAG